PLGCGAVVEAGHPGCERPLATTARDAASGARALAARAEALGLAAPGDRIPARVGLGDLLGGPPEPGLGAPLGRGADGAVVVADLVGQGPHALVAGTTGSGKSELLVSWVLGMAHG